MFQKSMSKINVCKGKVKEYSQKQLKNSLKKKERCFTSQNYSQHVQIQSVTVQLFTWLLVDLQGAMYLLYSQSNSYMQKL